MKFNIGKSILAVLLMGGVIVGYVTIGNSGKESKAAAGAGGGKEGGRGVTCLGRVDPDIIHLATPASTYPVPPPIAEILVKEGDRVKRDQVLAVLENKGRLETAWQSAEAQARVSALRLERIKAGAKEADILALKADVGRLAAELERALIEHNRNADLRKSGAVTTAEFDSSRLNLEAHERALESAKAKLRSLEEVRQIDVAVAEAEVQAATAEAQHAKAELGQAFIRAPIDGLVIKIHTHRGERFGDKGILDLADTSAPLVTAEVYETDIRQVKTGQRAEVSSPAFPNKMQGTVEQLGYSVRKNSIVDTDPSGVTDARIVEVKIRMEPSPWLERLIGARVTVSIQP